jgi:hypothetical protein
MEDVPILPVEFGKEGVPWCVDRDLGQVDFGDLFEGLSVDFSTPDDVGTGVSSLSGHLDGLLETLRNVTVLEPSFGVPCDDNVSSAWKSLSDGLMGFSSH